MKSISTIRDSSSPISTMGDLGLMEQYLRVRRTSMRCCAPLTIEDHSLQAMPDASPAKWHLAHTTWFFETFLLAEHLPDYRPFHPALRNLFNSYYNAGAARPWRAMRHTLSRPGLDEVHAYRSYGDDAIVHILTTEAAPELVALITLGINHEQQHQELIVTDVKNGLWTNPLRPAFRPTPESHRTPSVSAVVPPIEWRSFDEGIYSAGFAGEGFAFDNEGPRHNVYLERFRLDSRVARQGKYLEFMRDNGYGTAELWLSDGWDCVRSNQWSAPLYWEQRADDWWHYTVEGMKPLELSEPVCQIGRAHV